jgi:hypothetical protein
MTSYNIPSSFLDVLEVDPALAQYQISPNARVARKRLV